MIRYIRTTQQPLTEAVAAEFATMPAHRGERPLRRSHVDWLKGKIDSGLFHPPRWAVAWLAGQRYRVNGQHSSTALAESDGRFPQSLPVIVDEYSCDTDDDMADLFAQFDAKGSVRNETEIIMASARQHDQLNQLKSTTIRTAVQGLVSAMTKMGETRGRVHAEEKRALIQDNIDFILWTKEFLGTGRMRLSGVVAAMAVTFRVNKKAATDFWNLVRTESHPTPDNPTRALGRFLATFYEGNDFNRAKGKPWTSRAVYAKCIHAWNAWRKGETTRLPYYEDSELPEAA